MRTCAILAAALLLAAPAAATPPAPDPSPVLNPHTREACLHCHRSGVAGAGRTQIFSSSEEPHAAVASSCRTCHKEAPDFWLLILPGGGGGGSAPAAPAAPPADRAAVGISGGEGFDNSHDAMDCAKCHDKPADQLKQGVAAPPRFAEQGVEVFCRSCHSAVDASHYPRGNVPRAGTTCLNCHRVHGRALLFPSLRDDFPTVLAESTEFNPHGGKIFCLACHPDTPQAGSPVNFRFPGESLRLCQRCHGGVEHHPLGVKSTPATWKMDFARFPLEGETVTCVTCHKPPECLGQAGRENPRFLRGGPYNAAPDFCARCHEDKKFSSLDPHDQLDESGEVYQKKCLYCHITVPAASESGDGMRFTDTQTALCISCHQTGPHPQMEHLRPMPHQMRQNLKAYEELRMVRLPLDDGNVTCVTCHNPHERGLLKGPGGIGADEDKRLRLTTYNEQCTPCHGRH